MKKNAIAQYLKYAIGEIILVMVGILLALQVNNWNENRKDRIKENNILVELHSDFKNNLKQFQPVKENQINTLRSGQIVFRNINKLEIDNSRDSVYKHATNMFGGYPFHPSNGVVESLISSGDFKLISNDTLRKLIVSWKDVLGRYTDHVNMDINLWTDKIEPYVMQNGNFLNLASDKNKNLLIDPVFINMLVRKQFFQRNIVNSIYGENGLESYLNEIVRLTQS